MGSEYIPKLPPIESFKLRNILDSIDDPLLTKLKPIKATIQASRNYSRDLDDQVGHILDIEQREIVNRMEDILGRYNKVTRNITIIHKEINNDANEFDKTTTSNDFKTISATMIQSKRRIDRLVRRLKRIEKKLPGRERLFQHKSPHELHYHQLHKYGMKGEPIPESILKEAKTTTKATISLDTKDANDVEGTDMILPTAEEPSDKYDIKRKQYLQLEEDVYGLMKRTTSITKGSSSSFVNPAISIINSSQDQVGGAELNPEVITMKTTMNHAKDEYIINGLKKMLNN